MGLLTAPFPQNDPTALARLVLSGMSQLQENLKAQQDIAQNEQENFLAQSKMAASNVMNIANIQANNREAARRSSQDSFNNMIGLQELGIKQTEASGMNAYRGAETSLLLNRLGAPSIASPTAPVGDVIGGAPALPSGGMGVPPSDMAAPNMPGQPQQGPGAPVQNSLLTQQLDATPPAQNSPQIMSEDLAAGAAAAGNSAVMGSAGGVPGLLGQIPSAQTNSMLMQTPPPGGAAPTAVPASPAPPTAPATTSSKPWIAPDGTVDLAKLPAGKKVQISPDAQAERYQEGKASLLQLYKPVLKQNPNGRQETVYVPNGPPKPIMPEALAQAPIPVLSTTDKVSAYETAKHFLEKEYPKMPVKDRQALAPQEQQMYQTFLQLSNDPEVQAHTRKVGSVDAAIPADEIVTGHHFDSKSGLMVPTTRKAMPDELKAAASQRADIKLANDQLIKAKKEVEDMKGTKDKGGGRYKVALAKVRALEQLQTTLNSDFVNRAGAAPQAPGAAAPAAPPSKSAASYYGQ